MTQAHVLKSWPVNFHPVIRGEKRAEFRRDDRNFNVGDIIRLVEWLPRQRHYTGQDVVLTITHIDRGPPHIPEGYALLSVRILTPAELEAVHAEAQGAAWARFMWGVAG